MNDRSLSFLKQTFSKHYSSSAVEIWVPKEMEKREFGFFLGKEKMMVRHKRFKSREQLFKFLVEEAPLDTYYSVATYDYPEEEMSEKGWRNADIAFDIDADHLDHQCRNDHDIWFCHGCGKEGKGTRPTRCPSCNNKKLSEITWICDQCLGMAKQEVYKLIEALTEDLGIDDAMTRIFFSGHRGYHVHIEGSLSSVDQAARKEIVDYLTGTGIDFELLGLVYDRKSRDRSIHLSPGWGARMARSLYEIVNDKEFEAKAMRGRKLPIPIKRRILDELAAGSLATLCKTVNRKKLEALLVSAAKEVSVRVDPVVTADIHRLFRLPETLHGKTGLVKKEVPYENLAYFDPLRDAVVFKGMPKKVQINHAPRFKLSDEWYGPYSNETVTVPQEVAVFLICKGVAELSD